MTGEILDRLDSTSSPFAADITTGAGSVAALIISKGGFTSRFTPSGTIKPFGQDTGTADDNTVLAQYSALDSAL